VQYYLSEGRFELGWTWAWGIAGSEIYIGRCKLSGSSGIDIWNLGLGKHLSVTLDVVTGVINVVERFFRWKCSAQTGSGPSIRSLRNLEGSGKIANSVSKKFMCRSSVFSGRDS